MPKIYNCNKCVSQLYICFADVQLVLQLCYFFAVVLISCMIPTYNFAVLPFFLQLYIWFCSCNFFCSCTIFFCVEQNLFSDPIFIYFRTTLKHMASHVILLQWPLALLFSRHLVRLVVVLPLIKSPPPFCRRLSLRHCLTCLLSAQLVVACNLSGGQVFLTKRISNAKCGKGAYAASSTVEYRR